MITSILRPFSIKCSSDEQLQSCSYYVLPSGVHFIECKEFLVKLFVFSFFGLGFFCLFGFGFTFYVGKSGFILRMPSKVSLGEDAPLIALTACPY